MNRRSVLSFAAAVSLTAVSSVFAGLKPNNFSGYLTLTLSGYEGTEELANYPLLVKVSESVPGFRYADCPVDSIRFADASGAVIPHEVDTWNASGVSFLWVRVPTVSGKDTFVRMYFGGSGASEEKSTENVWSAAGYKSVWHLNIADGATADSVSGVAGTVQNPNDYCGAGTGMVGGDYCNVENMDNMHGILISSVTGFTPATSGVATYSAWVRQVGGTGSTTQPDPENYPRIKWKDKWGNCGTVINTKNKGTGTNAGGLSLDLEGQSNTFQKMQVRDSVATGANVSNPSTLYDKVWHYMVVTYDGTNRKFWIDGIVQPNFSKAATHKNPSGVVHFGYREDSNTSCVWTGDLDEIRFRSGCSSGDWLAAEYKNVSDYGSFVTATHTPTDTTLPKLTDTSAVVSGDGTVTIRATFESNLPADGSAKVVVGEGEYSLVTSDVSVPAVYTATISTLVPNTTHDYSILFASTGGTELSEDARSPFYLGDIVVVKTADADEATLASGVFTVTRADSGSALPVTYAVGGTATAGEDYVELSGTVVIPEGETSAQIEVKPLFNAEQEQDVTVVVTLTAGAYGVSDATKTDSLTIVNSTLNPFVQYVSTTGDDSRNGQTVATAKATINAALASLAEFTDSGVALTVYLCDGDYAFDSGDSDGTTVAIPVTITSLSEDVSKVRITKTKTSTRIFKLNHANACVSRLTIYGGSNVEGGAVYVDSNGGTVEDCMISNCVNTAWNADGAVYVKAGRVSRCTFTANAYARNGAALYATGGVIENCLFYGNSCGSAGAVCLNGAAVLANCTVVGNTGTSYSGVKMSNASGKAVNCAIFGNTAPNSVSGPVYSANGKCFYGCAADLAIDGGNGCFVGEPLFLDAAKNDYRLTPASCCVDAGTDPSTFASYDKDIGGATRVVDVIDVGCYEQQKAELGCSFTMTLSQQTIPATATFVAKVCGASGEVSGTWDFGDGSTEPLDSSLTATHEYAVAGTYTVSLTVVSKTEVAYVRKDLVKVAPDTMYVCYGNADAEYPYDTEETAAAKLADAVVAAADGVTIYVLPGEGGVHTQTVCVTLDKAVRVLGATGDPKDVTFENTIMNDDGHQLFLLNHPQAFLGNVTLKNGSLRANNSMGAGFRIKAGGGTVSNCVVNSAQAQHFSSYAAGAYVEAGLVTHTRFTGTFTTCPAYNGNPSDKGVVAAISGSGSMENCLFEDIVLKPSTINDGTACGPVVSVLGGTMLNCTIVGNCKCVPTTSTDAKFSLYDGGSGLYSSSAGLVKNCVVVNVTNAMDAVTPFAGTASRFCNCAGDGATVWGGTACINGAPEAFFRNVAKPDYRPAGPLLNAGTEVSLHAHTDLAGRPRVSGKAVDIGCFEGASGGTVIIVR